jgi:hypothetical protein
LSKTACFYNQSAEQQSSIKQHDNIMNIQRTQTTSAKQQSSIQLHDIMAI